MRLRTLVSVVTLVLLGLVVFAAQDEIVRAWELMSRVNIWLLLLLIPLQITLFYTAGEMIFSFLRAKGSTKHINWSTLARMAFEVNFVNHILPSGGVSGFTYLNWRLREYGVSAARATMAHAVRFFAAFVAFAMLLIVALVVVTIDGSVNRWIILLSALLLGGIIFITIGVSWILSGQQRMHKAAQRIARWCNAVVRVLTFGKVHRALQVQRVEQFFHELHDDFVIIRRDKKLLKRPIVWGLVYTCIYVAMFMVTFAALGEWVNPAVLLIGYGIATFIGMIVLTPGGVGAYEALMVAFLVVAGVEGKTAIAGVVLTRTILLVGTIAFGYVFYQHAVLRHGGKPPISR